MVTELGPGGKIVTMIGIFLAALWLDLNINNPHAWIVFPVVVAWCLLVIIVSAIHGRYVSQRSSGHGHDDSQEDSGHSRNVTHTSSGQCRCVSQSSDGQDTNDSHRDSGPA